MEKIVLEVPSALKGIASALRGVISVAAEQLERAGARGPANYESFEGELAAALRVVECGVHAAALSSLDVDEPILLINGRRHARVMRSTTTFMAQAGEVEVSRALYRLCWERNSAVVDIVALRTGAIEGVWLPGTARAMAYELQQGTPREAVGSARNMGRLPYSHTSFHTVGHAVGQRYVAAHATIERELIERFHVPGESSSISVSLDRVSIPMEEPRIEEPGQPKSTQRKRKSQREKRKKVAKNPISVKYRMAYVGTVTLHDEDGSALHTIRYGTMPSGDPQALCRGMANDVLHIVSQRPRLRLSLLCDGAPEMWNLLDAEFNAETFGNRPIARLIDFWHLIEKLAPAARVLFGEKAAKNNATRWTIGLLNRSGAASEICKELVTSGKDNSEFDKECPVHSAITYLTNNGERMNYRAARGAGLPIGSGNVEATCKTLFGLRFKRSGARWKTATGEHIVHLRALALSDRWDDAMDITLVCPRVSIRRAA